MQGQGNVSKHSRGPHRIVGAVALAVLTAGGAVAAATGAAAAGAATVASPGSGTLTKCRSWIFFRSCRKYHHVALPTHISVGDKVRLHYGSNPKYYDFPVAQIRRHGRGCTLLSSAPGAADSGDKIEIGTCRPAPSASAGR